MRRTRIVVRPTAVRPLYGRRLTDEATCYKAARTELWRALDLRAERFELCPEMTAKLCRRGVALIEVPIAYHPLGTAAGKKIGWRDAVQTVWTLFRWRILPVGATPRSSFVPPRSRLRRPPSSPSASPI